MGMDSYIDKIKRDPNDKNNILERVELIYWRKFYEVNAVLGYGDNMYGKDLSLTKDEVKKILQVVTYNRDYFGGFDTVPAVCDLYDMYDDYKADGWQIVFNSNW